MRTTTPELLRLAVLNNAEWCGLVARAHGLADVLGEDLWASSCRTPELYPDAVTLRPRVPVPTVLAAVDTAAGCSVKDSFADLELGAHGFRVLVEGRWIGRSGPAARPSSGIHLAWSAAASEGDLADFADAWGAGGPHPFRRVLLDDPRVTLLTGRRDGTVVAGAVLNDTGPVTGVSNAFAVGPDASALWTELDAAMAARLRGRPMVGWSSVAEVGGPLSRGFSKLGPLRVWMR